jgi:hypothetical protein
MKKLFYGLSSSRSFAKLFSKPMHARLDKRRRVMFPKSSVFAVIALAAFVSLGALLFPQVGQAQECIWDCDLGSDFFNFPGENSPGFSILYCFDQPCVAGLGIFSGAIPNASVSQCPSKTVSGVETCLTPADTFTCPANIMITGNVVAVRKANGAVVPASAAEATLSIVVKDVACDLSGGTPPSDLVKEVLLTDLPGEVFAADSNINILAHSSQTGLDSPNWKNTGCPTNSKGILTDNCKFRLGIDASKDQAALDAKFPVFGILGLDEVYRGFGLGRAVQMRMCKGDANQPSSSIACTVGGIVAVGGFKADAVFNFEGNWSGADGKTINPKSTTGPFDVVTPLAADIVLNDPLHPVTASANGGSPVVGTSCSTIPNPDRLRCTFPANQLLPPPKGCINNTVVQVEVSGIVSLDANPNGAVKFLSEDFPLCNNSPKK